MGKENEKEVVRLKQLNENQFKTIRELKEKNKALVESGEEMGREITHLKRVIAGQKGKIKQLTNEVDKWKRLEKEANELYEERIAETERLKGVVDYHNSLPWYKRIFGF